MTEVGGVVLAAGLSTRSGSYKMTLPLGDRTVIECSVLGMLHVAYRVQVVVGWQARLVRDALAGYDRVELVYNERYRDGMLCSAQAGFARVEADRFFLLPGDMPLVGPAVYERLLDAPGEVVIPTYGGQTGHPVLLSRRLVPEILALPPSATLRDFFAAQGWQGVEVPERGILIDVDTPEDYAACKAAVEGACHPRNGS